MNNILIKTQKQIDGIRRSSQLAARTLQHVRPYVIPGVTTMELDHIIHKFIDGNGAESATLGYQISGKRPYPNSCCISVNEVVCHGIPNKLVLKEGDIVSIDVTTILYGYYGDTATTFAVGEISDDAKHLMKVAAKCLDLGINQVAPGKKTGEIGHAIYSYAILQGCTVVDQYCGHGVGLQFHEPPQIAHVSKRNEGVPMFSGMIFTIEPMINLGGPDIEHDCDEWTVRTKDGSLSAQFEHTVLVNDSGFEILTML